MIFPNAFSGIRKIFISQILAVCSTVMLAISSVLSFILIVILKATKSGVNLSMDSGTLFDVFLVITGIFTFAFAVLFIVSFVFNIIGISNAIRDENSFKIAAVAIILNLAFVLTGVIAARTQVGTLSDIMNILSTIADTLAYVFVIQGIRNISLKLGNVSMDNLGNTILKILLGAVVLEFIANIVVLIYNSNASSFASAVITLIAIILTFVQYILYMVYLAKAKNMLAAAK